ALYQKIIEGLSQCEGSKHTENENLHTPIQFGKMKGEIQIDTNALPSMTGVEADVLDILVCQYVNEPDLLEKGTSIYLDSILQQRGLQPKLNGNGRRGGYERKQRRQIKDALYVLEHVYLNIKNVTVYVEGSPKTIDVKGHLLQQMKRDTEKLDVHTHFQFRLHAVFQLFLMGSPRQTKLFSKQVIAYDPYRKKGEKRLGRYLSWRWRTQARKGNYIQPHKVGTLLAKINMQENYSAPSRLRDRLETALDVLAEDGVIQSWQYESWDETIALKKGWFEKWKNATLVIFPPIEIINYYQRLTRKDSPPLKKHQRISTEPQLGEKMKEKRIQTQQTQQNVADTLGISSSYVSNLERNIVNPTEKMYQDIQTWLYTM